jgi:hypothetical protein
MVLEAGPPEDAAADVLVEETVWSYKLAADILVEEAAWYKSLAHLKTRLQVS